MSGISKKLMGTTAAGGGELLAIEDVFSTYLYTGNGSTQVIKNGINLGQSFGSGSVEFEQNSSYLKLPSEITLTGNFTVEAMVWSNSSFTSQNQVLGSDVGGGSNLNTQVYIQNSTNYLGLYDNSSAYFSTSAVPQDQWVHIAITRSGSTVTFYINGTASGTASTSATIAIWAVGALLAGSTVYEDYYGYLSNVRVVDGTAVYTGSFTPPTSDLTAVSGTELLTCQGDDPFVDNSPNAFTITQNGNPQAATFGPFDAAEPGEGGMVWIKSRTEGTYGGHALYDTERGATNPNNVLSTSGDAGVSATAAQYTSSPADRDLTSFNSDGFSLGPDSYFTKNTSGNNYASWTFRKAPRFFDCVEYTGNGALVTLQHSLGVAPGCVMVKRTDAAGDWIVYHRSTGATPKALYTQLNTTDARSGNTNVWNNADPTATEFYIGPAVSLTNISGANYVAYLFAHDPLGPSGDGSDGLIACGSYTGTGAAGNFVNLGWEPQWLLIKNASNPDNWWVLDNMRGLVTSGNDSLLQPNLSDAEVGSVNFADVAATGFYPQYGNSSGQTYIYIAIRRGPMRAPTSGTEVFDVEKTSGVSQPVLTTGFPTDLHAFKTTDVSQGAYWAARLTEKALVSSETSAETGDFTAWDSNTTVKTSVGSTGYVHYNFRRAPGFFDVVAYSGNSVAGRTVPHNLGVAPEMMIVKRRDGAFSWAVYHTGDGIGGNNGVSFLNLDIAAFSGVNYWNSTAPTEDAFTVGSDVVVNGSGTYVAYLFATLPGVSKVGSYTGTGAIQAVDCGFTSGARFVLIKRTDGTSPWWLWDTARGITTAADPFLDLNSDASETTGLDWLDPASSGFELPAGGNNNISGRTYIFLAIA